jgi:hypothetical protein
VIFLVARDAAVFHVLGSPRASDVNELRHETEQGLPCFFVQTPGVKNQESFEGPLGRFRLLDLEAVEFVQIKNFLGPPWAPAFLQTYFDFR